MAGWSELPAELLQEIFKKLLLSDHPSFISVCTSWRSVGLQNNALRANFVGLIVPGETIDSETRRLLQPTLGESEYCYHNDINARNIFVPHRYHCCGSGFGWLVLIDDFLDMHLFNPLSNSEIQLPSATIPASVANVKVFSKYHVYKAFLSCSPLSSSSQTLVLMKYGDIWAFCRTGNKTWTCIEPDAEMDFSNYMDAIYYREKFYMVYRAGQVIALSIDANVDHPTITACAPKPHGKKNVPKRYLVESEGELFQVRRSEVYFVSERECEHACGGAELFQLRPSKHACGGADEEDDFGYFRSYRTFKVKILKLKRGVYGKEWQKVVSIGDRAFFLGFNTSFSVSASDVMGCRPNSIYFTGDHPLLWPEPLRHDICVYWVDENRIEEVYPVDSEPMRPPPVWFAPFLCRN